MLYALQFCGDASKQLFLVLVTLCCTSNVVIFFLQLIKYIDVDVYGKCIDDAPSRVPMDVNKVGKCILCLNIHGKYLCIHMQ